MPQCLIIDRGPIAVKVAESVFKSIGFEVKHTHKFPDPILKSGESPPDVVMLDAGLAVEDTIQGTERIRGLREKMPNAHIVMCVKRYNHSFIRTACHHGIDDVIVKPYTVDDVMRRFSGDRFRPAGRTGEAESEAVMGEAVMGDAVMGDAGDES